MRGGAEQVMACLDARMGEVYWGCFAADSGRGLTARGTPAVAAAESVYVPLVGPFQGIGRGFAAYPVLQALAGLALAAGACAALPDAKDMARLGAVRLRLGEGRDPADLTPVYLRDKVALTELERAAAKRQPG
jgi:tRNA threonylcarbamoyladenosine biosynthesis protein TsaB